MNRFKKGDLVILKSGGPVMTVEDMGDYLMGGGPQNGVKCVWFNGPNRQEALFGEESLELNKPEKG